MYYLVPKRYRLPSNPDSTTSTLDDNPGVKPRRPIFTIEVRAEPGIDAIRALRLGLKRMLRYYGLRCISIREGDIGDAFLDDRLSTADRDDRRRRSPVRKALPVPAKASLTD